MKEVLERLIRIENKITEFTERISRLETKLENGYGNDIKDHEKRIRWLEKGFWTAIGALAILQIILKFIPIPFTGGQ